MNDGAGPSLHEALLFWGVLALIGLMTIVTYARLPPEELYNTSEEGLAGGLGRALVYVNYPVGLMAVAIVGVVADRFASRVLDALALAAVVLCAVVVVPGVVEQSDLDAKPVNAIPALGVALALGLTLAAYRRGGLGTRARRTAGDGVRIAAAVALLAISIPWWFAELGFYVTDVPALGSIFLAEEVYPEPGQPELRAVHLGRHHGIDGVLAALSALVLSRQLGRMRRPRLRAALALYLSLALAWGVGNAVQDFWLEQLVKRGTTDLEIPTMIRPAPDPVWAVLLLATAAIYLLLFRPRPVSARAA